MTFILNHIRHIFRLIGDRIDRVLEHAPTVVIGDGGPESSQEPSRINNDQVVVDFVGMGDRQNEGGKYDGICW